MKEIIIMLFSLGIILLGAEVFTNAIEWLGRKLRLGEGAVGSIFAAVGTALPETMIPVIAILSHGGSGGHDVGIGAILGAPFMLGTIAFFIVGLSVLLFRRSNRPLLITAKVMTRDLRFFIIVYTMAIIASFFPSHTLKMVIVVLLIGSYLTYVIQTIRHSHGGADEEEVLPPCHFWRKPCTPPMLVILAQVASALLIIIVGAELFVGSVQVVASDIGIPVFVLALIITPIATELPEKFNSILWLRRRKDTLALGNITGAMVFQSSMIPALGIAFTPWVLEPLALVSAFLALGSAGVQYMFLSRRGKLTPVGLLLGGLFYMVFIFAVIKGI